MSLRLTDAETEVPRKKACGRRGPPLVDAVALPAGSANDPVRGVGRLLVADALRPETQLSAVGVRGFSGRPFRFVSELLDECSGQ